MGGFYHCPYILQSDAVCNKGYYHSDECKVHQNTPKQIPCIHPECNKKTFSVYSTCKIYLDKYCSRAFYQCQKIQANNVKNLGIDLFDDGLEVVFRMNRIESN
ncbi:hypothetical protein C1645_835197 [Glomus cerebriforme]|uniref:Uncharacterized protein n=1 Tax=Glomus cerebriforme TaxID=658196 RepID=A0A397SJ59_9GLOM|nr:hypothetical protein C1645_835197 [Glomus cerebriforme]